MKIFSSLVKYSTAITLMVSSSIAAAQVTLTNKWDSEERQVIVDSHLPIGCDNATLNARDTLRQVNPAMNILFTWAALPDAGPDNTTAVNRASFGYGTAVVLGQTNSTASGPGFYQTYGSFVDADILMNHDMIYWPVTTDTSKTYDLWCDSGEVAFTSTQTDYQSVFLHELGHLVGFKHRTDATSGTCMMHQNSRRGLYNRSLCPDEQSALQNAY